MYTAPFSDERWIAATNAVERRLPCFRAPSNFLFIQLFCFIQATLFATNHVEHGTAEEDHAGQGLVPEAPVLLPACNWVWWLLSTWATKVVLLALAFGGICADLVDGKRSRCLGAADGGDTGARSQGGESKSSCWRHLWMDLVLVVRVQVGEGGLFPLR